MKNSLKTLAKIGVFLTGAIIYIYGFFIHINSPEEDKKPVPGKVLSKESDVPEEASASL